MYLIFKRCFDLVLSALACFLLLPVFVVVALIIRITSPGPALFVQKRFGAGKTFFQLYKFRTMRTDAPHDVPTDELQNPAAWITPIGRFLRKTSLDELPQLYNILLGHMSLVGPRPALWNQENLIACRDRVVGRWGKTANDLRPGLTGWAQINGRDLLDDEGKAAYDGEYAERISLAFDLKCLFLTAKAVFIADGVREGAEREKPAD